MTQKWTTPVFFFVAVVWALFLFGAPAGEAAAWDPTKFSGKRIAAVTGDDLARVARELLNAGDVVLFPHMGDLLEAVKTGRADAAIQSEVVVEALAAEEAYPELEFLYIPEDVYVIEAALVFHEPALRDRYNEFLKGLEADGVLDDMNRRWLSKKIPDALPEIPLDGKNGTLVAAEASGYAPMAFIGPGNELIGFDIEHMRRFAQYLGMNLRVDDMDYAGILPYVQSGRADVSACMVLVTEERRKNALFGDPVQRYRTVLAVRRTEGSVGGNAGVSEDSAAPPGGAERKDFSLWERLKAAVQKNLVQDGRWKMVLSGLGVTLEISLLAMFFGTLLGFLLCCALLCGNKIVLGAVRAYGALIQGTPMVVLLMVAYYILFSDVKVSSILIAVAAFALAEAVGIGGNLKNAIDTVDVTQIEAARSMGFSRLQTFFIVTLPQAVRVALPGYTSGFVSLVKSTAIVGYIAISDLSRVGDIIRARTFDAYFPLLMVAVIYLVITGICVRFFKWAIRKVNREVSP